MMAGTMTWTIWSGSYWGNDDEKEICNAAAEKMNPALAAMTQQRKEDVLISAAAKANLLIALMVLHDKFDYEEKRLQRFLGEYYKQLEAYNTGHVESVKDFETVLWKECGIKVEI